ncbi:nuclear transport factor 2 family protein [Streptomyces lomondensis]|uniref:Ketosteroid isomerase n=1 Tax=Streptomyces lomondensis TaxID=68229 RepID=A0ABQ2X3C6_9ACTN|nr:nuclear transport factor 2 family protein [Streptomyces lomondensis]MCF0079977.1 nuclear transport factor 2 family protein [Streptomyces lomondensis]GGW97018.1 ketosteroid isomerase [Streptomyces lomondensis]
MEPTTTYAVARRYADAVSAKDFAAVASMFADDIVWHQPGAHRLAGTYRGAAAVGEMFGAQMSATQGTFELALTGEPMVNGALVAIPVHFSAQREGAVLAMDGVDLLRIEGNKIAEVWLFSADQEAEDAFWGVD